LVISDIGMPEMDGYALMRALRDKNADILAIALTAYARSKTPNRHTSRVPSAPRQARRRVDRSCLATVEPSSCLFGVFGSRVCGERNREDIAFLSRSARIRA